MKQINVAEGDRAHGVAVIRAFEGKEARLHVSRGQAIRAPGTPRELVSQLECNFQRRRAVVGKENFLQFTIYDLRLTRPLEFRLQPVPGQPKGWTPTLICCFDQFFGEQRSRFVGQAKRGRVRDFLELPLDGGIDFGMIVSVEVGPDGRIGVEIFPTASVSKRRAFSFDNYNRLARQPVAHLRERMPDVRVIQFCQRMHFQFLIYDLRFTICSSARTSVATSAVECEAVRVTRRRAFPRATVG